MPERSLVATPTGLRVLPEGREIGFGRDWAGVKETMTRLRGTPDRRADCGAGEVVTWGAHVLRREGHRFVGLECGAPG